jgi:hypothetical protein
MTTSTVINNTTTIIITTSNNTNACPIVTTTQLCDHPRNRAWELSPQLFQQQASNLLVAAAHSSSCCCTYGCCGYCCWCLKYGRHQDAYSCLMTSVCSTLKRDHAIAVCLQSDSCRMLSTLQQQS